MAASLEATLDEVQLAADLGLRREVLIWMRSAPTWPFCEFRDWHRGARRKVLWSQAGIVMLMNVLGLFHKKNARPLSSTLR